MIGKGLTGKIYAGVGRMMPKAKAEALSLARTAMLNTPLGPGTPRKAAGNAAMKAHYIARGKKPTRIGAAVGILGTSTAMRPNANQSRTSYRGPMQTGRGSGRFA